MGIKVIDMKIWVVYGKLVDNEQTLQQSVQAEEPPGQRWAQWS